MGFFPEFGEETAQVVLDFLADHRLGDARTG